VQMIENNHHTYVTVKYDDKGNVVSSRWETGEYIHD
jgi:hypothetical protein